ncbi:hypothetical protein JVU11DRAFT_7358 [Chiua virens]|nr:hypothetical protein JVU11DRAFT_7358 [Chiua virens]
MTTSTSDIYERLVSLLTRCPQTIEILPGDWLRTQDPDHFISSAVGVFKFARTITVQRNHDPDTSLLRALTASSSVLLLANPSHQTALNARKHLVRMHMIDPH